jgi:hypothetical protein
MQNAAPNMGNGLLSARSSSNASKGACKGKNILLRFHFLPSFILFILACSKSCSLGLWKSLWDTLWRFGVEPWKWWDRQVILVRDGSVYYFYTLLFLFPSTFFSSFILINFVFAGRQWNWKRAALHQLRESAHANCSCLLFWWKYLKLRRNTRVAS